MSPDFGNQLLNDFRVEYEIEPEWLSPRDRGFVWWPGRLAQRVWVEDSRLHFEADVLREVPEGDNTLARVALINRFAISSALVFDANHHTLKFHSSLPITEHNVAQAARIVPTVAFMQIADADAKAIGLAKLFGGDPDFTSHPTSGSRTIGHGGLSMLDVLRAINASHVNAAERDFSPLERLDPPPWVMGFAGKGGMTAEFPLTGSEPAVVSVAGGEVSSPDTGLFQMTTDSENPQLGHGVLVRLTLPLNGDAQLANALNLAEACSPVVGASQLGAWCIDNECLVFVSFVPSCGFELTTLGGMALDASRRTLWAKDMLLGNFR